MLTADDFRSSKLRGFMVGDSRPGSRPSADFFGDAFACGANIGRMFVTLTRNGDNYMVPDGTYDTINYYLSKTKFPVVLAVTAPAVNPGEDFWTKPALLNSLIYIWKEIARLYKDSEMVAGYDLLNEPVSSWPITKTSWNVWNDKAQQLYNAIRTYDSKHVVMVCPSPGGTSIAYYYGADFKPITGTNIVYSLHWYEPYNVTHWGVYPAFPMDSSIYYPGVENFTAWPPGPRDKNWVTQMLSFPKAWAQRYNIPIFVGEFSCVRWAPNNSRYLWLRDSINLFNAAGWSWAYHAWRSWPGWDAENDSTSTVLEDEIHDPYGPVITMLRRSFSAQYAGKELV